MLDEARARVPNHPWMRRPPDEPPTVLVGLRSHVTREVALDARETNGVGPGRPPKQHRGWRWPCPACGTELVLLARNVIGEVACVPCAEEHLAARFGRHPFPGPTRRSNDPATTPGRPARRDPTRRR